MMEDAVRARVLDQVAALGTRMFPMTLPQPTAVGTDPATLPAAVYQRVSTPPHVTLDGANALRGPRIRVDVWGETYGQVRTVGTAVRTALDGFRGPAGAEEIGGAFLVTEQSLYEDDTKLHRWLLEFHVWGEE